MAKKKAPTAETYGELCDLLSARFDGLSNQLKKISQFVLANPNDTALKTNADLARQIGVQPSSLIRFAQALDYDGFSEVQAIFKDRLVRQLPGVAESYSDRIQDLRREQSDKNKQSLTFLDTFIDINRSALEHLGKDINPDDLDTAIRMIKGADSVYILGQRRSFPAASFMYYGMSQLSIRSYLVDSVGGLLKEQINQMGKGDVLISITFPKYAEDVLSAIRTAKERGATIISMTDSPISPVVLESDVCFYTDISTVSGFRSFAATMCLAQALVINLG
ncbi:MurR/RpiR family transcriptional regulator [Paremcibacter congregatus]|nr:MurR/RpiR family transcriptional regulator [Paremcibacter congregatus]QDE26333.1 MurR/RpiR family transcriptional regulator [Paremcibacter congregatus]